MLASVFQVAAAVIDRSMPTARRFPPPWSVEETDARFIVRDANGRRSPTSIRGRAGTAHLLTRDEATPGSRENRYTRGPPAVDESLTGVTL